MGTLLDTGAGGGPAHPERASYAILGYGHSLRPRSFAMLHAREHLGVGQVGATRVHVETNSYSTE